MSILYVGIYRNGSTISEFANYSGNLDIIKANILQKIDLDINKGTIRNDTYFFNYINENNTTFMCIADNKFNRNDAFIFLSDIKNRFLENPEVNPSNFSKEMGYRMNFFNTTIENAKKLVQEQNNEIDELECQSETVRLLGESNFATPAASIRDDILRRKRFLYFVIGVVLLTALIIYGITSALCGGPSWNTCI